MGGGEGGFWGIFILYYKFIHSNSLSLRFALIGSTLSSPPSPTSARAAAANSTTTPAPAAASATSCTSSQSRECSSRA